METSRAAERQDPAMRRLAAAVVALAIGVTLCGFPDQPARADGGEGVPSMRSAPWYPSAPTGPPPQATLGPATRAAARAADVLDRIRLGLNDTRYQHATRVRERQGLFHWDCSGMAAWILRRSAPRALAAVGRERPVARDFYNAIERAPTERPRRGWQRLEHIRDARPGDVFAWLRPPDWPPRNTGHVGFVVEQPRRLLRYRDTWTVRIADATSVPHEDDTRGDDGVGGFGSGTIMFVTDGDGQGLGYGWFGSESRGVVPTRILFGRVSQ